MENEMIEQHATAQAINAFDAVSLHEKNIEPDRAISGDVASRNWQMGNLSNTDFKAMSLQINNALDYMDIPYNQGGFLTSEVGENILRKVDIIILLSNSKDGFVRKSNSSNKITIEKTGSPIKKAANFGIDAGGR